MPPNVHPDPDSIPPSPLTARSSPRLRTIQVLRRVGCVVLIVIVGLSGWQISRRMYYESSENDLLNSLRKRGAPTSIKDVEKLHLQKLEGVDREEWTRLYSDLAKLGQSEAELKNLLEQSDAMPADGAEWLVEPVLENWLDASRELRSQWNERILQSKSIPLELDLETNSGETKSGNQAACIAIRLVYLESIQAIRSRSPKNFVDAMDRLLVMAEKINCNPTAYALAVAGEAETRALNAIHVAVRHRFLSQVEYSQLDSLLSRRSSWQDRFVLAVQGERGALISTLDSIAERHGVFAYLLRSPSHRLTALQIFDRLEACRTDDIDSFSKTCDDLKWEIVDQTSSFLTSADNMAPAAALPLIASGTMIANRTMRTRFTRLAIQVELARLKQGRLPATLTELESPGLNLTQLRPVGGKPFGYRVNEQGTEGVLWGFSLLSKMRSTPDSPIPADDFAIENKFWTYQW